MQSSVKIAFNFFGTPLLEFIRCTTSFHPQHTRASHCPLSTHTHSEKHEGLDSPPQSPFSLFKHLLSERYHTVKTFMHPFQSSSLPNLIVLLQSPSLHFFTAFLPSDLTNFEYGSIWTVDKLLADFKSVNAFQHSPSADMLYPFLALPSDPLFALGVTQIVSSSLPLNQPGGFRPLSG
jgi:hypothetical protein